MDWSAPLRFRLRRVATAVALAGLCHSALLVVPRCAQAQNPTSRGAKRNLLETGKAQFEDQRYEESIQTLSAALLRPGASKEQRIEVYRFLAYNFIALSQEEEAEAAVRGLFSLDPEFALGANESPRFNDFFARVRKKWEQEGRPGLVTEQAPAPPVVTIRHVSPAEWEARKAVVVAGELVDPAGRAANVVVRYRKGARGKFTSINARFGRGRFRASLPALAVHPPLVEYYIEALDDAGLPVSARGDAATPLRIAVSDPDDRASVVASPWFWVAAAAVVGGGVATAVVVSRDSGSSGGPAQPATPTSRVIVVVGP
ncbi:MAG: hypothetical protein MUF54_08720 [Polyangiaceae bacterium]|jgi:hypothetical protein|nr:hypothetical protein [Polyangiaceae bacterium]